MSSTFTGRFKNKTVLTGASARIGRAVCITFAKVGANLVLISRNKERLQTLKKQIDHLVVLSLILPLDVAESNKVEEAELRIENELGPIYIWVNNAIIWVNNAIIAVFSTIKEIRPEEYLLYQAY